MHVGVGYGLANAIIIETNANNLIIIDTTENLLVLKQIYESVNFKKGKPRKIKKVIFTHHHPDHIMGVGYLAELAESFGQDLYDPSQVDIIAHATFLNHAERLAATVKSVYGRAAGQFGNLNPPELQLNSGLGPLLVVDKSLKITFTEPTTTFEEDLKFTLDEINFHLFYAPGETDDQINIYLPDENFLFIGDNLYESFPNIYAIRGVPNRSAKQWSNSIRKCIRIVDENTNNSQSPSAPLTIIGSHHEPIRQDAIEILTTYADGIQFVHDATIRLMNQSKLSREEIVRQVIESYPEKFKNFYYLKEYYGTLEWSIKGILDGYLGWFDGDVKNLKIYENKEKRWLEVLGGCQKVVETVSSGLEKIEKQKPQAEDSIVSQQSSEDTTPWHLSHTWSASETENDLLFYLDLISLCKDQNLELYNQILKYLANYQSNPLARNYFLKVALDVDDSFSPAMQKRAIKSKYASSLNGIFNSITTMMRPGFKHNKYWLQVYITDLDKYFNIVYDNYNYHRFVGPEIENSLLRSQDYSHGPSFKIEVEEQDLRDFLAAPGSGVLNFISGRKNIKLSGDKMEFINFISYLEQ